MRVQTKTVFFSYSDEHNSNMHQTRNTYELKLEITKTVNCESFSGLSSLLQFDKTNLQK